MPSKAGKRPPEDGETVPQTKRSRGGGGDAISRNMRGSDVVLSIPEHVKWHIVYLVEILKFAPHIIAQTELSFGKNRSGTVALCSVYPRTATGTQF